MGEVVSGCSLQCTNDNGGQLGPAPIHGKCATRGCEQVLPWVLPMAAHTVVFTAAAMRLTSDAPQTPFVRSVFKTMNTGRRLRGRCLPRLLPSVQIGSRARVDGKPSFAESPTPARRVKRSAHDTWGPLSSPHRPYVQRLAADRGAALPEGRSAPGSFAGIAVCGIRFRSAIGQGSPTAAARCW
ncbi:hypothetical protein BU14_0053s0047 [Porphyra umbilicalis]|uniref:Uncharacterized protein n=1 Tax=Porphyra umbilicalis TaxID=2786 RepID=A0A1X6PHL5_PORUM|nr:hypothetical protein BU14_0053s0047 [Porphyra umbilicalis]|eukprot:OSX80384.1 hypothetical protein BU14_0053s0047 [Porphyra umbilicalis]